MKIEPLSSSKWCLDFSIVIPVKNEADNIAVLSSEIDNSMHKTGYAWECIWVDDGSTDSTPAILERIAGENPCHRYMSLSKNFGQSAALYAGFCFARGKLIATLDGDCQNDPADILKLIAILNKGNFDMVNGVRRDRRDNHIRKVSSFIGNSFRNWLTDEEIQDVGCAMRVFRHQCITCIPVFKGMHRFLPTLIRGSGYSRIMEIAVNHRSRKYGVTKYGVWNRLWVGIIDSLMVRWMKKRMVRPAVRGVSSQQVTLAAKAA